MKDIIYVKDEYYIRANSSLAEEQVRVLKHGDMFAVFNRDGNIRPLGFENHGLYFEGTRFLSRYVMHINHRHPLLLSSTVKDENELMAVDFTNPDISGSDGQLIPKGQVHIFRSCFLKDQVLYEEIRVANYGLEPVEFVFGLEFGADYRDIFEVRGMSRSARGEIRDTVVQKEGMQLSYEGLDKLVRTTAVSATPRPETVDGNSMEFRISLKSKEQKELYISIACQTGRQRSIALTFDRALEEWRTDFCSIRRERCRIETSNEQFNEWLRRSSADLFMMLTKTPDGLYPYAGIPWFSTVFGRDGLITAIESLWIYPQMARGVLEYLSTHQAKELLPQSDGEPGKILHEVRKGEMANLQEIPFGKYYGSIDSTLLYLVLAGYYFQRSGDKTLIKKIWPSLLLALQWIYDYGDPDGDGFVEYERKSIGGLSQQGWKDSEDPVSHEDGRLAEPPIALCEVQAYQYEAKVQMARLAQVMGDDALNRKLTGESLQLKKNFIKAFWCKDRGMLAIALDGQKKPCRILSSNAGQCLFSGILPQPMAARIQKQMMAPHFFTGWGVRTLSDSEVRYNPMSYHNGSIWPHDNALIAWGLSRYDFKDAAVKILTGMFDASISVDLHRLPELFCGFPRRPSEGPTLYPVACNPQAWASASAFMLLQSALGMRIDAVEGKLYFIRPALPPYLEEVRIRNLQVGKACVDINLEYHPEDVGIKVVRRSGKVEIVDLK